MARSAIRHHSRRRIVRSGPERGPQVPREVRGSGTAAAALRQTALSASARPRSGEHCVAPLSAIEIDTETSPARIDARAPQISAKAVAAELVAKPERTLGAARTAAPARSYWIVRREPWGEQGSDDEEKHHAQAEHRSAAATQSAPRFCFPPGLGFYFLK